MTWSQANQGMCLSAGLPAKESQLGQQTNKKHTKVNRGKGKVLPWAGRDPARGWVLRFGTSSSGKTWISRGEVRRGPCAAWGWSPCPARRSCGTRADSEDCYLHTWWKKNFPMTLTFVFNTAQLETLMKVLQEHWWKTSLYPPYVKYVVIMAVRIWVEYAVCYNFIRHLKIHYSN